MLKTIREEQIGKVTLRLLQTKEGFAGIIVGAGRDAIRGENEEEVWNKLRAEVGKAHPDYFGYDGARTRFLKLFPDGFTGRAFATHEREYKDAAAEFLQKNLPLEVARGAGVDACEAAARAYAKTNMLSTFEHARTRELLKSANGVRFVQAAAALADGDHSALQKIAQLFKPHGAPSWPAATYLPFFWKPANHMFLKPEVTKDYAQRVGHQFALEYGAQLDGSVYACLLDLVAETKRELSELSPRDHIDIQSFIWTVGAYDGDKTVVSV
jgi:hypothetical protein